MSLELFWLTFAAGLAIFVGGAVRASLFKHNLNEEFNCFMIAFGGGLLISAVGVVLVPISDENLNIALFGVCFLSGALLTMYLDNILSRHDTELSQFFAMFLDFVPEAMLVGAMLINRPKIAYLMTIYIVLQNIPEGYNAYAELRKKFSSKITFILLLSGAVFGPMAGLFGFWLSNVDYTLIYIIMAIASGSIVYLMFEDIAPLAKISGRTLPATGAAIGYCIAMFAHNIIG